MTRMLTVDQVATRLGIGRDTVYRLLAKGKLGGTRIERLWRVSEEDLQRYLDAQTSGPTVAPKPAPSTRRVVR